MINSWLLSFQLPDRDVNNENLNTKENLFCPVCDSRGVFKDSKDLAKHVDEHFNKTTKYEDENIESEYHTQYSYQ